MVETNRALDGSWDIEVHALTSDDQVDPADTSAFVIQLGDGTGGWHTLGRHVPVPAEHVFGLCALHDGGRVIVPAGLTVDASAPQLRAEQATEGARSVRLSYRHDEEGAGATYYLLLKPTAGWSSRRRLEAPSPTAFALHSSRPNPAGVDGTVIAFDLPIATRVSLELFDVLGRRVASIAKGTYPAGYHTATWDLRDASGSAVPPGVYVYRLIAGEFHERRKLSVLR